MSIDVRAACVQQQQYTEAVTHQEGGAVCTVLWVFQWGHHGTSHLERKKKVKKNSTLMIQNNPLLTGSNQDEFPYNDCSKSSAESTKKSTPKRCILSTLSFLPPPSHASEHTIISFQFSSWKRTDTFFATFHFLQKHRLLIPVTNSLKLMRESLFSSRRRKSRPASTGVCAPQAQGVRLMNSSLNCSMSMRYCSR